MKLGLGVAPLCDRCACLSNEFADAQIRHAGWGCDPRLATDEANDDADRGCDA